MEWICGPVCYGQTVTQAELEFWVVIVICSHQNITILCLEPCQMQNSVKCVYMYPAIACHTDEITSISCAFYSEDKTIQNRAAVLQYMKSSCYAGSLTNLMVSNNISYENCPGKRSCTIRLLTTINRTSMDVVSGPDEKLMGKWVTELSTCYKQILINMVVFHTTHVLLSYNTTMNNCILRTSLSF